MVCVLALQASIDIVSLRDKNNGQTSLRTTKSTNGQTTGKHNAFAGQMHKNKKQKDFTTFLNLPSALMFLQCERTHGKS